jgi:hypothetical protein
MCFEKLLKRCKSNLQNKWVFRKVRSDFLKMLIHRKATELIELGRQFALTADHEIKMNNYPINKQELEFGLTVPMARKAAFHEC